MTNVERNLPPGRLRWEALGNAVKGAAGNNRAKFIIVAHSYNPSTQETQVGSQSVRLAWAT